MADRAKLQEAVVSLIKSDAELGKLQVEVFPEDPEAFLKTGFKHARGAILVSYAGSRPDAGEAGHPRQYSLDLVFLGKRVVGNAGVLAWLTRAEDNVLADARFMLDGAPYEVVFTDDEFLQEIDQVHQYLVRILVKPI